MDYTSRYGLEFNPFIKNSKETLVETKEYKEVVYRLKYLLETRGFGVITGSAGKGKTTVIRNWSRSLSPSLYKVIYIPLSTITVVEFYKQLISELGLEPRHRKVDNFKLIQEGINHLVIDKRITPIIILDEANYMLPSILNDLKIIFNFEMDSRDKAIIILVGLPHLNNTLRQTLHEPLRQRITMNFQLEGLSKEEAKNYIEGKLQGAGSTFNVFDDQAIESIINASNGIARNINKLCNLSLMIGNQKQEVMVSSDTVCSAVEESELS